MGVKTTYNEKMGTYGVSKDGASVAAGFSSPEQAMSTYKKDGSFDDITPYESRTSSGRRGSSRTSSPSPTQPELRGIDTMGDLYGITYDQDTIRGKFDKATQKEFARKDKEYGITEDKFSDHLYGTQISALDSIRRNAAEAMATGASRGMQSANELSAVLGLTQEGAAGATELAQERNLLKDREAEAYTQNVVEAMQRSNELRQALAGLDSQLYATDTQFAVGEMDQHARIHAADQQLAGMEAQADAQRHTADRSYDASVDTATINAEAQEMAANIAAEANLGVAEKNKLATIIAAELSKDAQLGAAELGLQGTKYAADQQLAGVQAQAAASRFTGGAGGGTSAGQTGTTAEGIMEAFFADPLDPEKQTAARMIMSRHGADTSIIDKTIEERQALKDKGDAVRAKEEGWHPNMRGGSETPIMEKMPIDSRSFWWR